MRHPSFIIILLLWSGLALSSAATYELHDLGAFQPSVIAGDWIVGVEHDRPVRLHWPTGQKSILADYGQWGYANAVLPSGEAAGYVAVPGTGGQLQQTAAFWTAAGELFLLAGTVPSLAMGVNPSISLAGHGDACCGGVIQAKRWWADGREEYLGTLGGLNSFGAGIDAAHQVWGTADTPTASHATVFGTDGVNIDLGALDGNVSRLNGVTLDGVAIGTSGSFAIRATVTGGLTALPKPQGFVSCEGLGMASTLAAVGACRLSSGSETSAIWWPDHTIAVDLNTVTATGGRWLQRASSLNTDGMIVGSMLDQQGQRLGYLLTPRPPEPPSEPPPPSPPSWRDLVLAKLCSKRPEMAICH